MRDVIEKEFVLFNKFNSENGISYGSINSIAEIYRNHGALEISISSRKYKGVLCDGRYKIRLDVPSLLYGNISFKMAEHSILSISEQFENIFNMRSNRAVNLIKYLREDAEVKAKKKRQDREGVVYMITAGEYTKIGATRRAVEDRIKELDTGCPLEISKIRTFKMYDGSYYKIEKVLHCMFKDKNAKGEWFLLNDDDIKSAENTLSEYSIRSKKW